MEDTAISDHAALTRRSAISLTRFLQNGLVVSRRLFLGFVVAYAATSLLLGGSPAARWVFHALVSSWCGLVVLTFSLTPARTAGRCAVLRQRLELIGINVAFTLVLAEGGLRLLAGWSGKSLLLTDALESYLLVRDKDYGHGLRGNRLGFPGPDFASEMRAGVFRIAALGDSFAVGPAVPFAKNYLTLLGASRPDVEVYNFGVSGTGPREYRLILRQHVWTFQPDLVLVSVFVGNDITEWLATPREMDPRQSALYLFVTRAWKLWREQSRNKTVQEPFTQDRLAGAGLSPEAFLKVEARRLAICLKSPPSGLEKKWQRALSYLEDMVRDCQRRRVPVAFVLIPDEFQVSPKVLSDALAAAGLQASDVDLQRPQRRLREFFAARQVPCLDLRPAFAGGGDTYAPRDTHWNERGNELAARRILMWLEEICRTDFNPSSEHG